MIILAATNRMDILDKAFISRFPIKQEKIQNLIGEGGDQRQIMNYIIQALAEKIAEEKNYD